MTLRLVLLVLPAILLGCDPSPVTTNEPVGTVLTPVPQSNLPEEPMPEKRPHEMTLHGETRVDEYYWLRDDTRSDPDVLAYLEEENAYFEKSMAPLEALQKTVLGEITSRIKPEDLSVPYLRDGYWYYSRYEPGKEYAIHSRRKGDMQAVEEILVDGNERAGKHEFWDLRGLVVSDDHRYVAIAEDTGGRRINDIRILDTAKTEFLPEVVEYGSESMAFSTDGKYLFYHKIHPQTLLEQQLMRHELGTDPAADVLVHDEQDVTYYSWIYRSRSGKYLFLYHQNTDSTEVQWMAADNPLGEFRPFLPREPDHEYDIDHANGRFYIRSNWQAENFRLFSATLEQSADKSQWTELIPHRDDALLLNVQAFDKWLVLGERRNGLRQVRVMAHDGSLDRYLASDEKAYMMWPGLNVSTDTDSIRYGFTSLVTPTQTWEIDLNTGESSLLKASIVPGYNSENFRTDRISIAARDGEEVPVTLAWHKDHPPGEKTPALIYGYGSYGASIDPGFDSSVISLLDRGFVYAIAHIRGGQEKGRRWYEDGRLLNKKNTFYDFIDVSRGLQQQGLIDATRTYAHGVSAGGLLMGAVLNMAPEVYHGAIVDVPFVDVVTTMLDESIPLTTGEFNEWGNPANQEDYEYMLSYSPYDQISEQAYPNIYVSTGLQDSQVQYYEPAKWVARLRDRRTDNNRLIFHTSMAAGHSGVSGRYRQQLETAQKYAFILDLSGQEN